MYVLPIHFFTFSSSFEIPIFFPDLNFNSYNAFDLRNLQGKLKIWYVSKIVLTWLCLKTLLKWCQKFCNLPWISKSYSQSLEFFFLPVSQNTFFYFGLWLDLSCTRIATIYSFFSKKQVFISPPTCQHLHNLAAMIWKPTLHMAI